MLAKRLNSIITPSSPGINNKGLPTINVYGDEIALEAYWRILEMAEAGRNKEEIVTYIVTVTESTAPDASNRVGKLIDNVLENQMMCKASGTILGVKQVRASIATNSSSKSRKSTVLEKARRITTHFSSSEPILLSPVSPEREEEKLVMEALKLAAERAINKTVPDSTAKRRATATIDKPLKESLQRHQAIDEDLASDDARTRIELARQNLN